MQLSESSLLSPRIVTIVMLPVAKDGDANSRKWDSASSFQTLYWIGLWFSCLFNECLCVFGLHGDRRCLTLSNPVPWQNWMAVYLGYTLRMRTLFRGWPVMVNDTHTRRRWWHLYLIIYGYILYFTFQWADPGGIGPWHGWLTIVLQFYDTVVWVIWHAKCPRNDLWLVGSVAER